MTIRKAIAVTGLGALPFVVSCGGGEAPKSEAPAAPPKSAAAPAAAASSPAAPPSRARSPSRAPPPAAEKVKLNADPKCAEMHKDGLERQPIQVKDGGLADVLVYVKSPVSGTFPRPPRPCPRPEGLRLHAPHGGDAGRPGPQDPQQRRHPAQHPSPPDRERRVQRRPAQQGMEIRQDLRQGRGHDPGRLRRAPLDARLHLGLSQPVLRGHARKTAPSRSRACPRASTRSRPSTASSRARPRRSR